MSESTLCGRSNMMRSDPRDLLGQICTASALRVAHPVGRGINFRRVLLLACRYDIRA